jgi:anaerobic magnesium-protoporphyrin IX monomethyl ester cyclase
MDILLIDPPQTVLKGQPTTRGYNMGLTYLAAYLRENDIETAILTGDLLADFSSSNPLTAFIPNWLRVNMKSLAEGQRLLEASLNDKNHPIWKKLGDTVRRINPTAAGITYHTPLKSTIEIIVRIIREVNPDIKVIVGSFHPTFCPDEVMQNPDIDFAVRGEGEVPLMHLIREIKKDSPKWETVPGIHYRDSDGKLRNNADADIIRDLDELSFPARDLVLDCDFSVYNHHSMLTARGCPYSCAFCADKRLWGGTVRRRSVGNVIEEMKLLKDTYNTNYVEIVDGTFTYDKDYLEKFCNMKIEQVPNMKWGCTARYDNLDEGILKLMKKAGCYGLYIGLESGSNKVLKSINKKETIEKNIEISKMIYDCGIMTATSILLGSPDETKEDIEETLHIMTHFKTDFFDVNSYMPLPGTPYYDALSEEERKAINWPKTGLKSFDNYFSKHMSREELGVYRDKAYKIANRRRIRSILRLGLKKVFNPISRIFSRE